MQTNKLNDTSIKSTIESLEGAKPEHLAQLRAAIEQEFSRQLAAVDQLRDTLAQSAAGLGSKRRRTRKPKSAANGAAPSQSAYAAG